MLRCGCVGGRGASGDFDIIIIAVVIGIDGVWMGAQGLFLKIGQRICVCAFIGI